MIKTVYQIHERDDYGDYIILVSEHRSRDAAIRKLQEYRRWGMDVSLMSLAKG